MRRDAYADFLQAAADVEFAEVVKPTENPIDKLIGAQARAALFANSDVQDAASALVDAVREVGECNPRTENCYGTAQGEFGDAAKAQLEPSD